VLPSSNQYNLPCLACLPACLASIQHYKIKSGDFALFVTPPRRDNPSAALRSP